MRRWPSFDLPDPEPSNGSLRLLKFLLDAHGIGEVAPVTPTAGNTAGSHVRHVKRIQTRVNDLEAGLAVDGSFGPASEREARAFQGTKGLSVDGVVGPATRKPLFSA